MAEGLSKTASDEVRCIIKEEFAEMKAWIKESVVCSTHCQERMFTHEKTMDCIENKIASHVQSHEDFKKNAGFFGSTLKFAWPVVAAILTYLGFNFK